MAKKPTKAQISAAEQEKAAEVAAPAPASVAQDAGAADPAPADEGETLGQSDYFDGMAKSGMDFELETLKGDLRRDMLDRVKQLRAPWPQLTSQEQSDVANGLDLYAKTVIRRMVHILTREASESTTVKLTDVQIKGSKGINGKINCENIEVNRRLMMDNCDAMVKIVFVDSDIFMGEREPEKTDPDQPEIPFDSGNEDQEKALADAILAVVSEQRAATSFIQRKLGIGYNKADTLIARMEELGIITGADDKGARTVLANDPQKALRVAGLVAADPEEGEEGEAAEILPSEEKANAALDREEAANLSEDNSLSFSSLPKPTADLATPEELAGQLPPGITAADVE